jgi:hypothetical protein
MDNKGFEEVDVRFNEIESNVQAIEARLQALESREQLRRHPDYQGSGGTQV